MTVSVVWSGVREFGAALGEMGEKASAGARRVVTDGLHLAEAKMKDHAGEGGRHDPGTPTPATQGAGPAVITGTLRRSIRVGELIPWGIGGWSGEVGPTAIYGRRIELEYNYPYAGPGWLEVVPELPAIARRVWAEAI